MQQSYSKLTIALRTLVLLGAGIMWLGGCAETSLPEATGKGDVRGINAIVTTQEVSFLIEERPLGVIDFKGHRSSSWDDLSYNFNFDLLRPGDEDATRIATAAVDVAIDTEYIISLTGSLATPDVVRWEQPLRRWEGNESTVSVAFGNLAATSAAIDVYLAAEGVAPSAGAARASFAFGGFAPGIELPAGDYVITITPQNDPNTIVHQSAVRTFAAAASYIVGVFDPDAATTSQYYVQVMLDAGSTIIAPDINSPPTTRLVNAAFDAGNVDLYLNSDFSAPLFADVAYGQVTERKDSTAGGVALAVTAAGNQGAMLLETTSSNNPSSLNTLLFAGTSAQYILQNALDNPQGVETFSNVRFMQASSNFTAVDIYIYRAGDDINELFPNFLLPGTGFVSGYRGFLEGTYEIAVTRPGEKGMIGTLSGISLAKGDVAEFVVLDNADPNFVDLLQLPN
jgi:hypothetical protein